MPEQAKGKKPPIIAIALVVIVFPIVYSVVSFVLAGSADQEEIFLERPEGKTDLCVEDLDPVEMRYNHWVILRRIREEAVRYGMRGKINLLRCKECHTSRERFCDRCHGAVSVTPDCFDCHHYP